MRTDANAASPDDSPEYASRSVPPWPPDGTGSPLSLSHWIAFVKTSCRPAGTAVVNVPLPVDPRALAAVKVTSTDASVAPRFPSVISETNRSPFAPAASTTTGTVRTDSAPVRVREPVQRAGVAVHGVDLAGFVLAEAREGEARLQELLRLPSGGASPESPDASAAVVRVEVDPGEPREIVPAVDEAAGDRAAARVRVLGDGRRDAGDAAARRPG